MKKLILLLTTSILFSFIGCGSGGSNKEEQEPHQKVLQVIGIYEEIVVNVCQDENRNVRCEDFELQTKVNLNRDDSFSDILEKISLTNDGKYFLETRDITKPILLELQDSANVTYDDGKFTIPFSGFKNHEDNETKELSILASMVDKKYLTDSELTSIRNLKNIDTQDKFYTKLLEGLEENINTLRAVGLNSQDTMSANIKEMANQLIADGIKDRLPQDLNRCGTDDKCIDKRLDTFYNSIIISETKAESIKRERENTTTPTTQNNKKGLLVSKEIRVNNYKDNKTKNTITFEYNSKNQHIKYIVIYTDEKGYSSKRVCNINYDRDKYIGDVCSYTTRNSNGETKTTHSNTDIIYKDNKLYKELGYTDGNLSHFSEVLEWSENKPIKWKGIGYNSHTGEEVTNSSWSATYSGDNTTHLERIDKYGSWSRDVKEFDSKKTPYHYSWREEEFYFGGNDINNIIEETITMTSSNIKSIANIKNSITYNSLDMPTRIDSNTSSNGNYTESSYIIYEYIEAK